MKYVFSKEKCIATNKIDPKKVPSWVDECDGKEVTFKNESYGVVKGIGVEIAGQLREFQALKDWCEVVE
ncbi:hypothetical protein MWG07_00455 [Fusobacterium necrophorum]|uniref:Uncharacterized protein n=1 Tax=Fusobacterium necrophorum TaxID=859 RepID=A0AAW6W876_9FUSO|nr:hypothetical protein [Fusobacterium necrophorum]MDK4479947.1 hypothetical protein [Fusobacterium necrophorum]MDK4510736.1 hypothetical protein [Fusobacterium necrophorum]